jgi:ferritin-like metal-binding protein YciE
MKKMKNLEDLLLDMVRDVYYAEKQIIKALPKMIKKAHSGELKDAFEQHLEETQHQVERLESVFEELGASVRAKKCAAMDGIIEEGKEHMEMEMEPSVMDASMIVTAQKIEHYEIAAYGSIRTFAEILGYEEVVNILQETLDEESATDKKLTEIAQTINEEASEEGEGDSEKSSRELAF